jgi:hypothetical protein
MPEEDDSPERLVIRSGSSLLDIIERKLRMIDDGKGWLNTEDALFYIRTTNVFAVLDDPGVQERLEEVRKKMGGENVP